MTLPASGAISFNNINVELLNPGTTTASLGQASYRTLAGVASGAISMSNFYGKSNRRTASYVYSSPASNQTLNITTLSGYIAGLSCITITVNPGVYVYSTSTSTPALAITGGTPGDNVRLVNNGYIMGQGGTGADGGYNTYTPYEGPYPGGPAISLSYPVTIDNTNGSAYIGGGGGGGAYGYTYYEATSDSPASFDSYGGGGGAGGGSTNTKYAEFVLYNGCCLVYQYEYYPGAAGGYIGQAGATPGVSSYGDFTSKNGGGGGRIFPGVGGLGGGGYLSDGVRDTRGHGGGAGGGGAAACNVYFYGGDNTGDGGSANNPGNPSYSWYYRGGYRIASTINGGGGGGWGASGGPSYAGHGAGGKAVVLNGKSVTWVSGDTTRVWGGVS
jgi:hypothetical protein